jgi:hypothetical protein
LSTTATVVADDDGGIAYAKTVNFIKNYETDEIALFKLNFINQIE